jgi:hypothetical protein
MEFGEYFSKSFGVMFKRKPYLAGLLIGFVMLIITLLGGLVLSASALFSPSLLTSMAGGSMNMQMMSLGGMFATLIFLLLFYLVIVYLGSVALAFMLKKVAATIEKKKEPFFEGFGRSFLDGLLILVGIFVLSAVASVLFMVAMALMIIPILGWILGPILILLIYLWLYLAMGIFVGNLVLNKSFGSGLAKAFTLPFKKIMPWLYVFLFGLIAGAMVTVLILLILPFMLLPIVGVFFIILILLFLCPFIHNFLLGFIYCLSKE